MNEMLAALILFTLMTLALARCWRYFWCTSPDVALVRKLEPWYWFIFLNLVLSIFSSNFEFSYIPLAALLQIALSAWFAVTMRWITLSCPHEHVVSQRVWVDAERNLKFCYRCGTRMPWSAEATELKDSSWQIHFFHIPPHLFEYAVFWVAQSVIFIILLFLTLHALKRAGAQEIAAALAVMLVVGAPVGLYYWNRFKRYLLEDKGHLWMDEFKRSMIFWGLILAGLVALARLH
ncbi:MAG TPA: hypothetical protein VMU88_06105 [bacterium]|nr:hypothetical protein [bacterium]